MKFATKSQYITGKESFSAARTRNSYAFSGILTSFIAFIVLLSTVFVVLGGTVVAFADEDKTKETLGNLADDFLITQENEEGQKSLDFGATLSKAKKDRSTDNFAYVINRLFGTTYINKTPKNSQGSNANNCDPNNSAKGTPVYHNCDIPNIFTEFVQDFLATVIQSGPLGAETTTAHSGMMNIGLPTDIPHGGAAVDPNQRPVKYTALELFGYNLKYTSYSGEWDHIKIMTEARTMSNFGLMDNLKLGASALFNGIASGIGQGVTGFVDGLSSGNIFTAIGGFFTGAVKGATTSIVNTILDSSDQNVFDTYAWYRIGYGGTLYNARELSGTEIAANAQKQLFAMILDNELVAAQTPADLSSIKGGLPDPKEAISSCEYKSASGSFVKFGNTEIAPGISEEDCSVKAQNVATEVEASKSDDDDSATFEAEYRWDAEGTQALETLAQWVANNDDILKIVAKYNMNMTIDTTEANRATVIANTKNSWGSAWAEANETTLDLEQEEIGAEWMDKGLDPEEFSKWITADKSRNFNAPWNRFVCTDSKGNDLLDGNNQLIFAYDSDGNLNSACKAIRPPIQNGFFGNGYTNGHATDTRYDVVDTSIFGSLLDFNSINNAIGNAGLWVSSTVTRLSNAMMSLAFSPILSTLGIDKIVVTIVETLRDGIFFPLIALFVAITGIMALWSAGKNRDYGKQAVSLILMTLTILSGVFLMFMPDKMIKAVDEVPASIERAIVGNIFSIGNTTTDQLCTATGSSEGLKETDLEGKVMPYSASEGTRSLLCENWRTFAFNPWVYGQWGTNLDNLYAETTGRHNAMKNTNTALVGSAGVNMGGGVTMNNWGIYQLDTMTSGTASFADLSQVNGAINRDFYRIIDMQAGPNNGAGTDPTYFDNWTGGSIVRPVIGMVSGIVAIVGAVAVIVYSFAKIQISFVVVLMLIIAPVMFLMGIHPTAGRMKLKSYAGTIMGLIIQRIVLVLLLAIMFRVLSGMGSVSTDYFLTALMSVIICIAFIMLRKPVLDMVFSGISGSMGGAVGAQFISNPARFAGQQIGSPSFIRNRVQQAKSVVGSVATGAVSGVITGNGLRKSMGQSIQSEMTLLKNKQRRQGYGPLDTIVESGRRGKESAKRELDKDVYVEKVRSDVKRKSQPYQDYEKAMEMYESLEEKIQFDQKVRVDPKTGLVIPKPVMPSGYQEKNSARNLRTTAKLARTQRRLDNAMAKGQESKQTQRSREEIRNNINSTQQSQEYMDDAKRYKDEHDDMTGSKRKRKSKYEKLGDYHDKHEDKLVKRESKNYQRTNKVSHREMKNTLEELRKSVENSQDVQREQERKSRESQEREYDQAYDEEQYNTSGYDDGYNTTQNDPNEPLPDSYYEDQGPDEHDNYNGGY